MEAGLTESQIAYLLFVPDEVLIDNVFPRLPVDVMVNLCKVNVRFGQICLNGRLWAIRTINDFPSKVDSKPPTSTWREYYRTLHENAYKPIYYQGDRVGYVYFNENYLNTVNRYLAPFADHAKMIGGDFIFIDRDHNPIITVTYPEETMTILSTNYHTINKVVIMPKTVTPVTSRLIYTELTSPLGHPPIYGMYGTDGKLKILDGRRATPASDARFVVRGRRCDTFMRIHMADILLLLGVRKPPSPDHDFSSADIINALRSAGLKTDDRTQEELEYLHNWYYSFYSRKDLCDIVERALEEIGHIV